MRMMVLVLLAGAALAGCGNAGTEPAGAAFDDRAAIEQLLAQVNRAFETGDPDAFANGFAEDAVFELNATEPVYGYQRLKYQGRAQIREIISDRLERMRTADPKTLSYDPASLRRYNRNSDSLVELVDATHARHSSSWMVVMKTNVDIHISAVGRFEDELEKRGDEWLIVRRQRIE